MKRRILSIIIALGLSLGLLPGTAWAEEESSPEFRATSADINMAYDGFVFAQGVPIVIKENGVITSIYDADGNLLSGETDVSGYAIYGGWFDSGNAHADSTSIVMESGSVQAIFGGSYGDVLNGNTDITLNGGTVGWVYGGGNSSTVTGTCRVTVNPGSKIWGQKASDPSAADRGTIFGGGYGGTIGNTEVIFYGGDAQWIYGNGDGGCICGSTLVKFMGQADDFIQVYGGGNGGTVGIATVEFHGKGVSANRQNIYVYGGGWGDHVDEVEMIIGKGCEPPASPALFCAKNLDAGTSTVGSASFDVTMDPTRPSMMNGSGLDGTGVTGKVSACIHSDASMDHFIYTSLTEIDELILEGVNYTTATDDLDLGRLEIRESAAISISALANKTRTVKELAGGGRIYFEPLYNAAVEIVPITVDRITVAEGARLRVDRLRIPDATWTGAALFTGEGVTALNNLNGLTCVNENYALTREGNTIKVKENDGQKQAYLDPIPLFDRDNKTYRYGETIQVTMGLQCGGQPLAGQTVSVEGGVSGAQTFATGVTGQDGMATISVPVDDTVWNSRTSVLSGYFVGTEEYKENRYAVCGADGDYSYTILPAQVTLSGEITAPARDGVPVTALTVGGAGVCTAEVLWSPADAAFRPDVAYTASIRLIPKPGYGLDKGQLGASVTFGGEVLALPAQAEADGSLIIAGVRTFAAFPAIHPTGVTLNKTELSLTVGSSEQLTATVAPAEADNKSVTWTSSNPAVATVDASGNVTAVGTGTATITVTTADGGRTATCIITVIPQAIYVTGIMLNKTSTTLTVGDAERLTATVAPSDATDKAVTWASSNTAVATVDASGNVTAVSAGSATITVTTADGGKTATCTVTVRSNSGSSGSGSSGGGGTSGGSSVTVPVSGDQNTIHVSVSVSGSTATVSRIDTAQINNVIGDSVKTGMVEIDFTGLGKTIDTVKLPAAPIGEIAAAAQSPANDVTGLTIKLTTGEIAFDGKALAALYARAGSQITLTVTPARTADLNNWQREAVGNSPVFDLTLRSSSGAITDFRGGYATVSLPYTLTAGQNPSGVVVYYLDSTGNITPCATMYDVRSKAAIFTTGHLSLYFVGYDPAAVWVSPFSDVSEGAWYYDAVRYASENGLMGGYGNGLFGPNDNLSRAQFAQILFNREGRPVVNYLLQYGDVASGAWYTEAVRWATSQGIVGGYGNGMFGPNDNITREQLAVMLWRYAGSPAATHKELHFNDTDEISGYALEALRWAVENDIISGYGDGRLGPQGLATRAQTAQMLMNFLKK